MAALAHPLRTHRPAHGLTLDVTSFGAGTIAAALLLAFYATVIGMVGGSEHLRSQAVSDWPWLTVILAGFGTQVAMFAELRRRRRLDRAMAAASGSGTTASAVGMVACCAHHIADLAPVIGASGAAVFLTAYRVPIMSAGIAINLVGVALAAHRLRHTASTRK